MSVREQAIAAIIARVAAIPNGPAVIRNADAPVTVGAAGCVVVRDGDQLAVDGVLGPNRSYWITHRVELEVLANGDDREAGLDALIAAADAAISADRSLGNIVAWLETSIEEIETIAADGADAVKAALLGVTIEYESSAATG